MVTKIYHHEYNNAAVRGNFGDVSLSCQMSRRSLGDSVRFWKSASSGIFVKRSRFGFGGCRDSSESLFVSDRLFSASSIKSGLRSPHPGHLFEVIFLW